MIYNILLFWALPSLCTALLMISLIRADGEKLEDFDAMDACMILILAVAYPVGIFMMGSIWLGPILTKERSFGKDKV